MDVIPLMSAKTETSAVLVHKSPVHGLIGCGGEDGFLECFDLRQKASAGRMFAVGAGNEGQVRNEFISSGVRLLECPHCSRSRSVVGNVKALLRQS